MASTDTVASTIFGGNAAEEITSFDAYIQNAEAAARLEGAKNMTVSSNTGISDIGINIPNMDDILASANSLADRVKKLAEGDNYKTFRKTLKGIAQASEGEEVGLTRLQAVAVGLSTALPIQLTEACQAIIDNFKSKLKPRYKGYEKINNGLGEFIQSDQVQCAMDALGMLTGIKGLKNKIENTLVDIEATAQVLAGMITTLIDYDMVEDIEAVLGTSTSTIAVKRAIGIASANIGESGNLSMINWMLDEIGVSDALFYNSNLTYTILSNYDRSALSSPTGGSTPEDPNEYFFSTLTRIDPNWDKEGELYYFNVIKDASPDAISAFESYDPYRALNMVGNVEYFTSSTTNDPTVAEVTRDLYPSATGTGNKRLASTVEGVSDDMLYLYK